MRYAENVGAKMKRTIHDYFSAQTAYHDAHRGRGKGKIGNNTYIVTNVEGGGGYSIILHRTPIVTYHPDGRVTLRSGGYRTVTTKARMNEVLPGNIRVYQQRHDWFVSTPHGDIPFHDGMVVETGATTSHSGGPHEVNPGDIHVDIHSHNRRRRRKNPGKFADAVEAMLYGIDHDQTVGDVSENGYWYGLVVGLSMQDARNYVASVAGDIDVDEFVEDAKQYSWPLHAIITEDDQGFVDVYPFQNKKGVMESWRKIIRDFDTDLEER